MQTMLITGGSRGIGKAIADHFIEYDIVTISRSDGDLRDEKFRNEIINTYKPSVFINNAGIISNNLTEIFDTNTTAAIHLLDGFYHKMESGYIINIGSMRTQSNGFHLKQMDRIHYSISKKSLREASNFYSDLGLNSVKVSLLDIGTVDTTIDHKKINNPMQVQDIVNVVDYILSLPVHICVRTMEIPNALG